MSKRRHLRFESDDEILAEIARLRRGCDRAGNWTLAQACWHLNVALKARMLPGPFPSNTPEQENRRETVRSILAAGKLPDGIDAPVAMTPPPDCDDAVIDDLIETVKRFGSFGGPIAPHRLFGHLSDADARALNRIHFAHHLSYLVPTESPRS